VVELSFHGAAGTVTGSKYLLKTDRSAALIDCGVFQGSRELRQLNWNQPPFDPGSLSAAVVTHAHIDHIGYLPRLVKHGFKGPIYATPPTADLARISLLDSAELQEEDAAFRNKKKLTRHEVALPLYTTEDAEVALRQFMPMPFGRWIRLTDDMRCRYHVIGHVLGAASVEVQLSNGGAKTTILFSGDIGRYGNPLTIDPRPPAACDYLVCESTYGARLHEPVDPRAAFIELLNDVVRRKSVLLIPAFAVDRTQQITYLIKELIRYRLVPPIDIHIDSPMAVSATEIYCKYHAYHSVDLAKLGGDGCVIEGEGVFLHRKRESSQQLNRLAGPAVIMSASGMLTGGRIMHHLLNRLPDPNTTVALVGFMAQGTKGRELAEGARELYIHKQLVPVKARVIGIHGLSGHADFYEILHWLEPLSTGPKQVFVTHGEPEQSQAMAGHISEKFGWSCYVPQLGETVRLN